MATYTIVARNKTPLARSEIAAGQTVAVSQGDVFVISSGADADIGFEAAGGSAADFDVAIPGSNANDVTIKVTGNLGVAVTIGDNARLAGFNIDTRAGGPVVFRAGDNVTFGQFDGSASSANRFVIGEGFVTSRNWTGNGLTPGLDARVADGGGCRFGDGAGAKPPETGKDAVGDAGGSDQPDGGRKAKPIRLVANSELTGPGWSKGAVRLNARKFDQAHVFGFVGGTLIETGTGAVAIENLGVGDVVLTMTGRAMPLRWVGSFAVSAQMMEQDARLRPIRISRGAFGCGLPLRDLLVSPQHRVFVHSPIAARMFGSPEILVAAKRLVQLEGFDVVKPDRDVVYYNVLLDSHEIIFAENAVSTSLYLDKQALNALVANGAFTNPAAVSAWKSDRGEPEMARLCPPGGPKLNKFLRRHIGNKKALLPTKVEPRQTPETHLTRSRLQLVPSCGAALEPMRRQ